MANSGPTLAQLVRKWHRTYSSKNNWDFSYGTDTKTGKDDFSVGYLTFWKNEDYDAPRPAIMIEGDTARLGRWEAAGKAWGSYHSEFAETIHSDLKLIAADPRFFTKLDRAMQFLTRAKDRRRVNEDKFAAEEVALLKKVLG